MTTAEPKPFDGFEDDVADKSVGDDDIDLTFENLFAFGVADEPARCLSLPGLKAGKPVDQCQRGARQLVALAALFAVGKNADARKFG